MTDSVVEPVAIPTVSTTAKVRVLICLPWYKSVTPQTAFSTMGLIDRSRTSVMLNYGDAFVPHTRNVCADIFLKSDLDWMLTIDDDMIVPFGNAPWFNAYTGFNLPEPFASFNAIDRLMSHGKTLIGGLYFGRNAHGKCMYAEGCNTEAEAAITRRSVPQNVIKPTRWVATGCMLVHRSVFLDIEKKFPLLARRNGKGGQWFTSTEHDLTKAVDEARKLLANPNDAQAAYRALSALESGAAAARSNSSQGMGEDVAFCVRAKQAGHQPFVDFGLLCGHVGDCVYGPRNTKPRETRSV